MTHNLTSVITPKPPMIVNATAASLPSPYAVIADVCPILKQDGWRRGWKTSSRPFPGRSPASLLVQ